jgi:hypothetical protein
MLLHGLRICLKCISEIEQLKNIATGDSARLRRTARGPADIKDELVKHALAEQQPQFNQAIDCILMITREIYTIVEEKDGRKP